MILIMLLSYNKHQNKYHNTLNSYVREQPNIEDLMCAGMSSVPDCIEIKSASYQYEADKTLCVDREPFIKRT